MTRWKLYIWHDVLTDYTSGMAVALARNVEEARGLLAASGAYWGTDDLAKEPEVHPVNEPFCDYVRGGG
jgi:hypothetical protein